MRAFEKARMKITADAHLRDGVKAGVPGKRTARY